MITHDFSKLPVMQSEKRNLKSVISWHSIGQKLAVCTTESRKVKDLMEENYQLISNEISLFSALPFIIEHDYVLVKNKSDEICGIVTESDLSLQFKQMTEPFLLVGEIENYIRQILSTLGKSEIEKAKDEKDTERKIESVNDLTFGEYKRLFEKPEIWNKLNIAVDRKIFCEYLEKVRNIRNYIMHFDTDGLVDEEIETLRNFVRLLQTLKNLKVIQ